MPFFMDIHMVGEVSVEDTRKAHLADLAVQEKYGVIYHQYWFNKKAGTVFCLMEAPDKESCAATHLEANGITACNLVQVEGGMYDLFMGKKQTLDHGLVRREDGEIDTGYRYILSLSINANRHFSGRIKFDQLRLPEKPRRKALKVIGECEGKEVRTLSYDCIIAVFQDPSSAIKCAHKIQQKFLKYSDIPGTTNLSFNMGISIGQPLTEKEGFFTRAIQMSQRLCLIAGDKEIITSQIFRESCGIDDKLRAHINLRTINPLEQDFLDQLLDLIEDGLSDQSFGVELLSRKIGVSQPQLYRKITALTGRSPVAFIRDIRLKRALNLLKENKLNISQIALEVGYNSPSYFSKCFREKFGVKASKIAV